MRDEYRVCLLLSLLIFSPPPLRGQPSAADLLERKLIARIAHYDQSLDGVLGAAVVDLTDGRTFSYHGGTLFPQASSIKIPIMIRVFRSAREGAFRLDQPIRLEPRDSVGGSGHLHERLKKGPMNLTVREMVTAMIETSDNTATNRCIAMVGMDRVNRMLDEMDFTSTRLRRVMMDAAAASRNEENVSTPSDMVRLVETIYRGKAAHPDDCRDMLSILKLVKSQMRRAVPEGIEVASKPGGIPGVSCETGIVFLPGRPFAISVMATFLGGEKNPVEDVTRLIYAHFEKLSQANRYGHKLQ